MSPRERILRLRSQLNLSQKDLAESFGVTSGAIAHWENGDREIPGPVEILIELYELELGLIKSEAEFEPQVDECLLGKNRKIKTIQSAGYFLSAWIRATALSKFKFSSDINPIQERIWKSSIEKVSKELISLKALPQKVGQVLSYLTFSMPADVKSQFRYLLQESKPASKSQIRRVLYEEFSKEQQEIFKKWSDKPFAVGSLGQVHLAQIAPNKTVAVKVQFPAIRRHLQEDIGLIKKFGFLTRFFVREEFSGALLSELEESILQECDYNLEAKNQKLFSRYFSSNPLVLIPEIHQDYCRDRVLVSDYIPFQSYRAFLLSASREQRQVAGEIIWQFAFESVFNFGLVNTDPNIGNFLFGDNQVAFIDFGAVKKLDREFLKKWKQLFSKLMLKESNQSIMTSLQELKAIQSGDPIDEDAIIKLLKTIYGPCLEDRVYKYDDTYLREGFDQWFRGNSSLKKMVFPKEWLFLTRAMWGVASILSELEVEANWHKKALKILAANQSPVLPN